MLVLTLSNRTVRPAGPRLALTHSLTHDSTSNRASRRPTPVESVRTCPRPARRVAPPRFAAARFRFNLDHIT